MPGKGETTRALGPVESSCLQSSHWKLVLLDTGEEWATLTRNYAHTLEWVIEISLFPNFLAKLLNGKEHLLV